MDLVSKKEVVKFYAERSGCSVAVEVRHSMGLHRGGGPNGDGDGGGVLCHLGNGVSVESSGQHLAWCGSLTPSHVPRVLQLCSIICTKILVAVDKYLHEIK